MTDHDIKVAGDLGEMKADIRTVKHDLGSIQQGQIALGQKFDTVMTQVNDRVNSISNQQARGLGFFAGMACIITLFGGALIAFASFVMRGHT